MGCSCAVLGQALDGRDLARPSQEAASIVQRLHRAAVEMHHAGAALAGVAADMRAGEPQVLAQELHQQRARIDVGGGGLAVHRH